MLKYARLSVSILVVVVALTGCGGRVSGTQSAATYRGVYIDAPAKFLSYVASPSGITGTTDSDGTFKFKSGDTVSFSITTNN